jgi:CheY-like chemotaxis protein
VLTTVRSLAAKKHLRIEAVLPENPGLLDADETRIKQVLYNLLSNAIKFTEHEKRIGVEAHAEGGELVVTVWDQGIGIPAADLPHIFEPYMQSKTRRNAEGTGLGLAIVKKLVELHGGSVAVQSAQGTGSRFTVRLPGLHEKPAPQRREAAAPAGAEEIPDLAGKTALVVDDSPANRTLMEMMLGAFGCTVVLAGSGEEALKVAEQGSYDMVFMDIQLPGINGIETMRRMRQAGIRGPMIAITAYAMEGDAERFLAEGFDGYIAKPVRISEVLSYLEGM